MVKIIKHPQSYCAYNTLITGDGTVHRARSYNEAGEGTGTFKGFHLDICLTGNFNTERLSNGQLEALKDELKTIEQMYGSYVLKVHQDYYATDCCGMNLINWVRAQQRF